MKFVTYRFDILRCPKIYFEGFVVSIASLIDGIIGLLSLGLLEGNFGYLALGRLVRIQAEMEPRNR